MTPKEFDKIICQWTIDTGVSLTEKQLNLLVDTLSGVSSTKRGHVEQSAVPDEEKAAKLAVDLCLELGLTTSEEVATRIDELPSVSFVSTNVKAAQTIAKALVDFALASRPSSLPTESHVKGNDANFTQDKVREALEFIVNREDFSFAECSVAEEIWRKAKEALALLDGGGK